MISIVQKPNEEQFVFAIDLIAVDFVEWAPVELVRVSISNRFARLTVFDNILRHVLIKNKNAVLLRKKQE